MVSVYVSAHEMPSSPGRCVVCELGRTREPCPTWLEPRTMRFFNSTHAQERGVGPLSNNNLNPACGSKVACPRRAADAATRVPRHIDGLRRERGDCTRIARTWKRDRDTQPVDRPLFKAPRPRPAPQPDRRHCRHRGVRAKAGRARLARQPAWSHAGGLHLPLPHEAPRALRPPPQSFHGVLLQRRPHASSGIRHVTRVQGGACNASIVAQINAG